MYINLLILNVLTIRISQCLLLQNLCHSIFAVIPEIPQFPSPTGKRAFIRDRKLPFNKTIATTLSVVNSGKNRGLSGKIDDFVSRANLNKLWPDATPFDRTALSKARKKVDWREFEDILHKSYSVARNLWKQTPGDTWCGMSVFAIDGSAYTLPATESIRNEFDPHCGLQNQGKGHYPQCLVETAYDVLKYLPIARIVLPYNTSEREAAKKIIPCIPSGNLLLFDRGYPGFDFIHTLDKTYNGKFLIRCPVKNTFKEVIAFMESDKNDEVITLMPTLTYRTNHPAENKAGIESIIVRLIRLVSPDGTLSVLITNMIDKQKFCPVAIKNLYSDRYRIEEYFRHEKCTIELEKFHSKDPNGVRQELLAVVIVSIIARLMVNIRTGLKQPQFKNAVITLALDAALLAPTDPAVAVTYFNELLDRIARIKYYKPKKQRKPYLRITKRNKNKWIARRMNVLKCQP